MLPLSGVHHATVGHTLLLRLEPSDRDRGIGQTRTARRPLSHRMPQPGGVVAGGEI